MAKSIIKDKLNFEHIEGTPDFEQILEGLAMKFIENRRDQPSESPSNEGSKIS